MDGLTELERDALTELVNVGVSRAAVRLSRILSEPVQLSVPRLDTLPLLAAADTLAAQESAELVAVGQTFGGPFAGHALLIFPQESSLELVRAAVGPGPSLEEVADLEPEAIAEIGNVILNGCLVAIANTLKQSLDISLPTLLRGNARTILLAQREPLAGERVLFLYIDFAVRTRSLNGYIAVLMDLPALAELKALIRAFIDSLDTSKTP